MGTAFDFAGNVLMVKIDGELDHHVADGLRESVDRTFDNGNLKNIAFDFSGVTMMDSSGIGFVMGRYRKAESIGGKTVIMASNPYVNRILEMAGVFRLIRLCTDRKEAINYINAEVRH